ncbi:MAG: hypothetical protein WKF68_14985 [Daejeonella sp.]
MKYLRLVCYTLFLVVLSGAQLAKPVTVILFGDSITQAGVRPGGYITMMQEAAGTGYEMSGAGIGGNICAKHFWNII